MAISGRFKSFDFWDGAVFGAVTAVMLVLLLELAFHFLSSAGVSSIVAVLASLLGVLGLFYITRKQLEAQRAQANLEREQDLASAKTVLPLTLSRICRTSRRGVAFFADRSGKKIEEWSQIEKELHISDEDLSVLRDVVRSADPITRMWISTLIGRYQVALSKSLEIIAREQPKTESDQVLQMMLKHKVPNVFFEWSVINALSEHLFDFARGSITSAARKLDKDRLTFAIRAGEYDLSYDEEEQAREHLYMQKFGDGDITNFRYSPFWWQAPPTA